MKTTIAKKSVVIALILFIALNTQAQITHCAFTLSQKAQLHIGFTVDTSALPTITVADTTSGKIGKRYWVFDDGDFSNSVSPMHKYSKDGIYRVSLTATDTATGCQSKIEKEIKIKTTTVEPCRANYTFTLDTLTKTLTFTNKSSAGIDRNYWEFGDGTLTNAKAPVHAYKAPGYYKVSLTVIDTSAICFDIKSVVIKIDEKQKPCKADFTYNVDLTTQKIYFADHSDVPINSNYIWDFADGSISTMKSTEHAYAKGGFYDVCLTVSDTGSKCRNTTCQNLKASELPAFCHASYTYAVDSLTGNVNFYDNSKGKHNGWEWDYGDSTREKNQNGKHKFTPGYYTVRLKITDSETSCMSFNIAVINIQQPQKLKAGFDYEKKEGNAKGVLPIEFKGAGYGDASEVEWDFGDGATNNSSISPTHEYTKDSIYTACLKMHNSYTGESDSVCQQIVVVVTGIEKQTKNSSIALYPNPAIQSIVISSKSLENSDAEIQILNSLGQVVFANYCRLTTNYSIDISSLQKGIYFIKVQTDNGNVIEKMVKD